MSQEGRGTDAVAGRDRNIANYNHRQKGQLHQNYKDRERDQGAAGEKESSSDEDVYLLQLNRLVGERNALEVLQLAEKILRPKIEREVTSKQPRSDDTPITLRDLQEAIAEAIRPHQSTWAQVASSTTTRTSSEQAETAQQRTRTVPAKKEREIIIHTPNIPEELKNRNPRDTVTAINAATFPRGGARAIRQLPSGDVAVVLEDGQKDWYLLNTQWVQKTFGEEARVVSGGIAVYGKGIPDYLLSEGNEAQAKDAIEKENKVAVLRVKARRAREGDMPRRGCLYIELATTTDAYKLTDQGLYWEGQVFRCEPYENKLRPKQCFKCWAWGHHARYCKAEKRCARCAGAAHEGGEEECPTNLGEIAPRCCGCGGDHTAFDRSCPAAKEHWDRAKEAYQNRAIRLARPNNIATAATTAFNTRPADSSEDEAWQTVSGRKRPRTQTSLRGRPKDLTVAGRANGNTLDRFSSQLSSSTASLQPPSTLSLSSFASSQDNEVIANSQLPTNQPINTAADTIQVQL